MAPFPRCAGWLPRDRGPNHPNKVGSRLLIDSSAICFLRMQARDQRIYRFASPVAVTPSTGAPILSPSEGDAHTKSGRLILVIAFGWFGVPFGVHLASKRV